MTDAAAAAALGVAARRRRKKRENWIDNMRRRLVIYEWHAKLAEARPKARQFEAPPTRQGRSRSLQGRRPPR